MCSTTMKAMRLLPETINLIKKVCVITKKSRWIVIKEALDCYVEYNKLTIKED